MKNPLSSLSSAVGTFRSSLGLLAIITGFAALNASAQTRFRVVATPANTSGAVVTLDHPALNNKKTARPIITQYWTSVYNNNPIGVEYHAPSGRWRIRNENFAAIPANAQFNVLVAKGTKTHLVSAANSTSNYSVTTLAKKKPANRLFITHLCNPSATFESNFSTRYHGVWYVEPGPAYANQWAVYAENTQNIEALAFHVADVSNLKNGTSPASFTFVTAPGNIIGNTAAITHPLTDANPDALVYVQHNFTSTSPVYVNKPLGVYYFSGKWRIFTQDTSAMPNNAAFNILVLQPTP